MPVYLLDRGEIKAEARGLLRTAQVPPLRFTAMFLAIDLVLSEASTVVDYMLPDASDPAQLFSALPLPVLFVSILIGLLSTVLLAGYACYCLGVHRGDRMPYECLFDAFPFAGKVILLELLQFLLIALGTFAFVVPGVVLALCYAFSLYHLCEEPELGVIEAMRRSRTELRGYKLQLLMLLFSFLPLLLLVSAPVVLIDNFILADLFPETLGGDLLYTLAFGLLTAAASLFVTPYLSLTQVGFYRRVTAGGAPLSPENGTDPEP